VKRTSGARRRKEWLDCTALYRAVLWRVVCQSEGRKEGIGRDYITKNALGYL
jgi:hypothetical protein